MINDDNVILVKNNVDDDTRQFSTLYIKDHMSSLTIEGKSNTCIEYFDTSNSRNYFKKNFEKNEKLNGSPYLVWLI